MELRATKYDVTEQIAIVRLDRPHRANAWTGRMHTEWRWILGELETRDDVRAVIVTGSGDRFCVGGDSEALRGHVERGGYDTGLAPDPARPGGGTGLDADFAWQLGYRFPIIAAVNGACAGVGLALALFCDLRFVTPSAKMTTAAPRLGLPAEYGLSWTLPRLVGITRANDLLLSGRVFTGAETADWGLWNAVVDDPLAAAVDWATMLATTTGRVAVANAKRQLADDLVHHSPADSVTESIRLLDESMGSEEYAEGIAAFTERRPPNF